MPMLAEPKRKSKWTLNPRGTLWANDESKFGQKILEKAGWSKGKGLGKNEQGCPEPLKATFKDDDKGVGYKEVEDKTSVHIDTYEEILSQLNSYDEASNKGTPKNSTEKSLEKKSKESRARVHYHKFTRGKDTSLYNEDDLACILGSKKSKNGKLRNGKENDNIESDTPVDISTNAAKDDSEQSTSFINAGNSKDYFASKMAALKKKQEGGLLARDQSEFNPDDTCTKIPDLEYNPVKKLNDYFASKMVALKKKQEGGLLARGQSEFNPDDTCNKIPDLEFTPMKKDFSFNYTAAKLDNSSFDIPKEDITQIETGKSKKKKKKMKQVEDIIEVSTSKKEGKRKKQKEEQEIEDIADVSTDKKSKKKKMKLEEEEANVPVEVFTEVSTDKKSKKGKMKQEEGEENIAKVSSDKKSKKKKLKQEEEEEDITEVSTYKKSKKKKLKEEVDVDNEASTDKSKKEEITQELEEDIAEVSTDKKRKKKKSKQNDSVEISTEEIEDRKRKKKKSKGEEKEVEDISKVSEENLDNKTKKGILDKIEENTSNLKKKKKKDKYHEELEHSEENEEKIKIDNKINENFEEESENRIRKKKDKKRKRESMQSQSPSEQNDLNESYYAAANIVEHEEKKKSQKGEGPLVGQNQHQKKLMKTISSLSIGNLFKNKNNSPEQNLRKKIKLSAKESFRNITDFGERMKNKCLKEGQETSASFPQENNQAVQKGKKKKSSKAVKGEELLSAKESFRNIANSGERMKNKCLKEGQETSASFPQKNNQAVQKGKMKKSSKAVKGEEINKNGISEGLEKDICKTSDMRFKDIFKGSNITDIKGYPITC